MRGSFIGRRSIAILGLSFVLLGSIEHGHRFVAADSFSLDKTNLRRSRSLVDNKTTTRRYLEDSGNIEDTEKAVITENQKQDEEGSSSTTSEDTELQASGNEENNDTEQLEQIEKEFNGVNVGNGSNQQPATSAEEEAATTTTEEVSSEEKVEVQEELEVQSETAVETEPPKTDKPTMAPVPSPTNKPTEKYKPNDDIYDPVKAEDEKHEEEEKLNQLETELKQEEKVARQAGGLGIFFGIIAMIFTAHQMSENPDGIYASVCRLAITISSVVMKIICMPCRKLIGTGANGNPYGGHMPISTNDYSYRNDPYRSNANAGFEMR